MNTLRELLNERRWHRGDLDTLEVVIRHRGAPRDERVVPGAAIADIGPRGLTVRHDVAVTLLLGGDPDEAPEGDDGDVWIPYHRVLEVRAPAGTLWSKPAPKEA